MGNATRQVKRLDMGEEGRLLIESMPGCRPEARKLVQGILLSMDNATQQQKSDMAWIFRQISPRKSDDIEKSLDVLYSLERFFDKGQPPKEVLQAIKVSIERGLSRYESQAIGGSMLNVPRPRDLEYAKRMLILLDAVVYGSVTKKTAGITMYDEKGNRSEEPLSVVKEMTRRISKSDFKPEYLTDIFMRRLCDLAIFDMAALEDHVLPALRDESFDFKPRSLEELKEEVDRLLSVPKRA